MKKLKWISPEFFTAHEINPHGPEECNGLMERNFVSIIYIMFRNLPTYMEWFRNHDMGETYNYHKMQLQYLGFHFPMKQWVLKAPVHLLFLKYLFKTYPDARIIHTHRDPVKVIPSMASLGVISRQIHSDEVNANETAGQFLDLMGQNMTNSIQFRENYGDEQFLDISFSDLVNDTMHTTELIYQWLDVDFNKEVKTDISNWLVKSKNKRKGKPHLYSLEQFGLSENKIKNEFESYYDMYNEYI